MKRRDWLREKARQDFEDDLKERCVVCGKWAILNEYDECPKCEGLSDDGLLEAEV